MNGPMTDPMTGRFVPGTTRPLADRFWEKVIPEPNTGCFIWMGALAGVGYGLIGRGTTSEGLVYAHRLAWELEHGAVPTGVDLCHRCDNRWCVNVVHLFIGSRKDNVDDMFRKGRHGRTPASVILELRRLAALGVPRKEIAERLSLTINIVQATLGGRTWRYVR